MFRANALHWMDRKQKPNGKKKLARISFGALIIWKMPNNKPYLTISNRRFKLLTFFDPSHLSIGYLETIHKGTPTHTQTYENHAFCMQLDPKSNKCIRLQ